MIMWKFKSGPRCRGDVFLERDMYSWYERCLQCGYLRYLPSTVQVNYHSERNDKKELIRQLK